MQKQSHKNKSYRRSIRLRGWDYTTPGAYFVTICTHQRQNLFEDGQFKAVVEDAWRLIPTHPHASHVRLDEWVVMPNHLHGILTLEERKVEAPPGTGEETVLPPTSSLQPSNKAGSIGVIIGNFKSSVTKRIKNLRRGDRLQVWQRGYYDHIVRNERELEAIRRYVQENPLRWELDRDNLDALLAKMQKHEDVL